MPAKGQKHTPESRARLAAAARARFADPAEREKMRKIGQAKSHGKVGTPVYGSWYAMKRRVKTTQPKDLPYYRNLDMDPRWEYFENFYEDMGDRPEGYTLDRIDSDKGYWPENCRWATYREQRLNRKRILKK